MTDTITIYHNPDCGTSRNTLALIRNSGAEPRVIEYLKTPPDRDTLRGLIDAMGLSVRAVLREKGTPFAELHLDDVSVSDDALIEAMLAHPILINRPIVVTPLGTRLCRPSESRARHPAVAAARSVHQGRRRSSHRRAGPPCRLKSPAPCRTSMQT